MMRSLVNERIFCFPLVVALPPLISILPTYKKEIGEKQMKEINLRDYYPYYTKDKIVEVPDEVFVILEDFRRQEESYQRSLRRYKAFYSLDAENGIEKDILLEQPSPYEILERQRMIALLYQGLDALPEKQSRRIYAHYFLGMSISQVAKAECVNKSRISRSISAGLRGLEKYLKKFF